MSAPLKENEITFYDELGVASDATADQIRDAFRLMVRLLHPDQHSDPVLKEYAEAQMRKINRIHGVLSDPDRRRNYDLSLEADSRRMTPTIVFTQESGAKMRRLLARFAWAGAVAVSIVLLVWLASEGGANVASRAADNAQHQGSSTATEHKDNDELTSLRSRVKMLQGERDQAMRELSRLRGTPALTGAVAGAPRSNDSALDPDAMPSTMTELPGTPQKAVAAATASLISPQSAGTRMPASVPGSTQRFVGSWFYVRPAVNPSSSKGAPYPPEFIEATITESNGTLHGRYRSRYQILDRPISPDVNFEFNGAANGQTITCPWTGPGGARGEITAHLTGDNQLRVEWNAAELGSQQGLIRGSAVLTRRVE